MKNKTKAKCNGRLKDLHTYRNKLPTENDKLKNRIKSKRE